MFLLLYKVIVRTHSNQWKRTQRCSASFRRQYRFKFSPFRMLYGRHRGFPVMFCFSDVKGNITLSCIAFSRHVSPFPSFPVPAAFSCRAAAFPFAAQNVTAVFHVTEKSALFPSRKKAFSVFPFPKKTAKKAPSGCKKQPSHARIVGFCQFQNLSTRNVAQSFAMPIRYIRPEKSWSKSG